MAIIWLPPIGTIAKETHNGDTRPDISALLAGRPGLARWEYRDRAVHEAPESALGRRPHRPRRQKQARHHHRTQGRLRGAFPRPARGPALVLHLRLLVLRSLLRPVRRG